MVIGKAGNDPRLEDDASAQIFNTDMVLVSGAYANKFRRNLRTIFLTPFPTVIHPVLLIATYPIYC